MPVYEGLDRLSGQMAAIGNVAQPCAGMVPHPRPGCAGRKYQGKRSARSSAGPDFHRARKWSFVRAEAGPRYLAVNGDEGEPGTFKDRYYLRTRVPHVFLEGMLIAAWAVEAETCLYLYARRISGGSWRS